ncbi:unnamed protein product, partial [Agarophyton chilense]
GAAFATARPLGLAAAAAKPVSNALLPRASNSVCVEAPHLVFVYGTLKRGFANSSKLRDATYVGEYRTQTRYPLVVGGPHHSPYLLDLPTRGARVKGELYAVDDAVLAELDRLERVGVNYARARTVVRCCARGACVDAFVYLKRNDLARLARLRFLDDYQCRRYVPRHLRAAATP